ncbi:MAG: LytTR family transcriptional regulator DNA-binding domain-containing protein [Leptospiraceae bacterium]|nr:LytTR family transcriptional regulator DNA-binding domain-containing protein [Leptospiraceae bacterium]
MEILIYSSDTILSKKLKNILTEIVGAHIESLKIEKFNPEKENLKTFPKSDIIFLDFTKGGDVSEFINSKSKLGSSFVLMTKNYEGVQEGSNKAILDFIVQPVTNERIKITLDKFRKKGFNPNSISVLDNSSKKIVNIPISKLIYFEAEDKLCHAYISGGKKITIPQTLKSINRQLPEYFLRIHKSYIVRKDYIKNFFYVSGGSYRVSLKNSVELPVGRQYYKFVKATLMVK